MLHWIRRSNKFSLAILAVIFLLIFLHYTRILSPIENLVIRIISPVQNRVYSMGSGINNFYNFTKLKKDLVETNLLLEEKVKQLTIENARLKTALFEKERVDEQFSFLDNSGLEAINAKIIGKNLQPGFQTLVLNKGQRDGVRDGLPVVAEGGVIVGRIVETTKNNSQMILIDDSYSSVAATVFSEEQTKGVVVGDRGLSLKMDLIPQDHELEVGDVVVTSGLETDIPSGLVIGQVEEVIYNPNAFFKQAFLKPLVDFDDLIVVSILKNSE